MQAVKDALSRLRVFFDVMVKIIHGCSLHYCQRERMRQCSLHQVFGADAALVDAATK
jgi:hypothetical protein